MCVMRYEVRSDESGAVWVFLGCGGLCVWMWLLSVVVCGDDDDVGGVVKVYKMVNVVLLLLRTAVIAVFL